MTIVATGEMAVTPDLKGFESKMGSSLGGLAKKAALAFGGAFAATKAVSFLTSSIADARESNAIAAQTTNVIKTMGDAAHISAKGVDALANSISRKTGIDDEAIAKAENLLLTFGNVRNEAGKGNDIFTRTTQIATDMGKALGSDAASQAILLGKALNDPAKGAAALSRSGSLAKDDLEKLRKMGEKGVPILEQQKFVLAALEKQYGGTAAATATASDRLKVTIGNLKEDLGNKLIPVIDKVATFLANNLPTALAAGGAAFAAISRFLTPVVDGFMMFFNALRTGFTENEGTGIEAFALRVRAAIEDLVNVLTTVFSFVMDHKEILVGLAAGIAAVLVPAFVAWAVAAGSAAVATVAAALPVIAITAAIAALVAGLLYAYNHWTLFHNVVNTVAGFVRNTLIPAIGDIATIIGRVVGVIRDQLIVQFNTFKSIGVGVFSAVRGGVNFLVDAVRRAIELVQRLIDKIKHLPGAGIAGKALHTVGLPGFAEGGVVPGPLGRPQLAVVHGGEEVLTPAQRASGGGALVGQLIIQGATFEGANATAYATVREMRAEAFRQGRLP